MSNVQLGPKAQLVAEAAIQQIAPALEVIIAKICSAAGYHESEAKAAYVASLASLPSSSTTYTPPQGQLALPPTSPTECNNGRGDTSTHKDQDMSSCGCSSESLGCAIGDTVNQTKRFPATDVTGNPSIAGSCVLPPGFDNCLSYAGDLAPCDVDRIQRTRRRFVEIADTITGDLVDASATLSTELDTPTGYSWYRLSVPEIDVAHQLCPREFVLELDDDVAGGAGFATDVSGTIEEVAIQSEAIFQDGDGNFVHAWSFPKPADPDDLKITDGRCACERLCDCIRYFGDAAIAVLAPTLAANTAYRLTTKGVRDCWQISCGACPPAALCGREILA